MKKLGIAALIAVVAAIVLGVGFNYFHDRPYYPMSGIALPPDKASYAGLWRGADRLISIAADGKVHYERHTGNESVTLDIPLQKIDDHEFTLGALFWGTTFKIDAPPHADGDVWKMTIDGVEMTLQGGKSA